MNRITNLAKQDADTIQEIIRLATPLVDIGMISYSVRLPSGNVYVYDGSESISSSMRITTSVGNMSLGEYMDLATNR